MSRLTGIGVVLTIFQINDCGETDQHNIIQKCFKTKMKRLKNLQECSHHCCALG